MSARKSILPVVGAVVLVAAACGGGQAAPVPAAPRASGGEGRTAYPLTVRNCGGEYTFAQAPSRVVVMNGGSVAEVSTLLELGLGDRIVANAQNYGASEVEGRAEEIDALPTGAVALNDRQDIPREAMLSLRPDFVVSTYDGGFAQEAGSATREDLRKIGANSYAPAFSCGEAKTPSIEDSYALLRDFGEIFDVPKRAEKAIEGSKTRIDAVAGKVAAAPVGKVVVVFPNMGASDLSSIAVNGIWNDILRKAGAENAFADAGAEMFAEVSAEQAAVAEVDALVVVNYQNPDPMATARSLFSRFPQWRAAEDNRVVVLSDSIYLSPDNAAAVEKIAGLVHPDLF